MNLLWLIALFFGLACSAPQPPNIVIIAVGGLRADVQPASDTSSFLNGLLPMHLRNVHTSSTTAIPGVASLLTGKVPSAIPLCGHNATSKATPWCGDLPEQSRTLPEVLSLYGYKTALVTNGFPEMDSVEWRFGETLHLDSGERTNWTEVGERAANWWAQHSEPKLLVVLSNDLGLEHQAKNHSKWGVALQTVDNGAGKINQVEHPEALQSTYQQMANDTLLGAIQAFSFFQESPPPVRILTGLYGIDLGEGTPYPNQPIPTLSTNLLLDRTIRVPLWTNMNIPSPRQEQVLSLTDVLPTITELTQVVPPAGISGTSWYADDKSVYQAYAQFGDMRALRRGDLLLTFRGFVHGANTLDPLVSAELLKEPRSPTHFFLHNVKKDPHQQVNLVHTNKSDFHSMLEDLRTIEKKVRLSKEFQSTSQLKALRLGPGTGYW